MVAKGTATTNGFENRWVLAKLALLLLGAKYQIWWRTVYTHRSEGLRVSEGVQPTGGDGGVLLKGSRVACGLCWDHCSLIEVQRRLGVFSDAKPKLWIIPKRDFVPQQVFFFMFSYWLKKYFHLLNDSVIICSLSCECLKNILATLLHTLEVKSLE